MSFSLNSGFSSVRAPLKGLYKKIENIDNCGENAREIQNSAANPQKTQFYEVA